jgi:hypothetical protein
MRFGPYNVKDGVLSGAADESTALTGTDDKEFAYSGSGAAASSGGQMTHSGGGGTSSSQDGGNYPSSTNGSGATNSSAGTGGPEHLDVLGKPAKPEQLPAEKPSEEANLKIVEKPSGLPTTSKQSEGIDKNSVDYIINNTNQVPLVGSADIIALRQKWNVPDAETLAVAKTNVKGLERHTFEGASPKVLKKAGLPSLNEIMPNRLIKAPSNNPLFIQHAEEYVFNLFDQEVSKAGIDPSDVTGVLRVYQSNPAGVCRKCIQGLTNNLVEPGVVKQMSLRYPNLTIEITSEINDAVKVSGRSSLVVKNGIYVE